MNNSGSKRHQSCQQSATGGLTISAEVALRQRQGGNLFPSVTLSAKGDTGGAKHRPYQPFRTPAESLRSIEKSWPLRRSRPQHNTGG